MRLRLEADPCRADGEALLGEILLVLGHYVFARKLCVVKIACDEQGMQTAGLEFFKAEIKQTYVVGLEFKYSVLLKELAVDLKEGAVGKTALCVSRFRPRIDEIQIDAVNGMRLYTFLKYFCVADDEAKIVIRTLLGAFFCHFESHAAYVGDLFHSDEIHILHSCRHLAGEAALAASDLEMNGALLSERGAKALGEYGGVLYQQLGASFYSLGSVLFLSHSHSISPESIKR